MNKLLYTFLLFSGFVFGQQKELYKTVTYNDIITLYNAKLSLNGEDLAANIDRCAYILNDAKKRQDYGAETAWEIFCTGLKEAQEMKDKNMAYLSVYKDETSYNFYDSKGKFAGRIYKEKFEGNRQKPITTTEDYLEEYYHLIQE